MARLRYNFIGGLIEDNPLTAGATSMTSAALAALPVVSSPDVVAITFDPDGIEGSPEVAWVTNHGSGASTATIARMQEPGPGQVLGTGTQHSADIPWSHGPTLLDFVVEPLRTVTTNYTFLSGTDKVVLVDATGGARTVTLPVVAGLVAVVMKTDSSGNAVTIAGASGTVNGAANLALSSQYAAKTVRCDGTNFFAL